MKLICIVLVLLFGAACDNPGTPPKLQKTSTDSLPARSAERIKIIRPYPDELQERKVTVSFSYAAIACGCAPWYITQSKSRNIEDEVEHFYLEPRTDSLLKANSLWDGRHLPLTVKVSGRFSKQKEAPITYFSKSALEKARIFWYDEITIVTPASIR